MNNPTTYLFGGITAATLGLSVMTGATLAHVAAERLNVKPAADLEQLAAAGAGLIAVGSLTTIAARIRLDNDEAEAIAHELATIRRTR